MLLAVQPLKTNFKVKHTMQSGRKDGIQISDLFGSIFVLCVVFLFSSTSLFPQVVNNSLIESNAIKSGRYAVTFPALETIEAEAVSYTHLTLPTKKRV